eukprot:15306750-Alexandrium_andersonii.AAC.1
MGGGCWLRLRFPWVSPPEHQQPRTCSCGFAHPTSIARPHPTTRACANKGMSEHRSSGWLLAGISPPS